MSITVVDKMQMRCKPNETLDFAQMKAEASVHENSSPVRLLTGNALRSSS